MNIIVVKSLHNSKMYFSFSYDSLNLTSKQTFLHAECNKSNYIEYEHLSFAREIFMFASNLLKESREEG